MAQHGDAVPLVNQFKKSMLPSQHVDAASMARLLSPLPSYKQSDGFGALPSGMGSAPHLVPSVQAQKESMAQLLSDTSIASTMPDFIRSTNVTAMSDDGFGGVDALSVHEHGSTTLGGIHGSLQELLQSFTTIVPDQHMGANGISVVPRSNDNYDPSSTFEQKSEHIGSQVGANAAGGARESSSRNFVDESGYYSSESSLYDVDSDDEDYAYLEHGFHCLTGSEAAEWATEGRRTEDEQLGGIGAWLGIENSVYEEVRARGCSVLALPPDKGMSHQGRRRHKRTWRRAWFICQ